MEFNPLKGCLAELQRQVDELQQKALALSNELRWYQSIDPHALTDDLRGNQATAEKLRSEIGQLEIELQENAVRLSAIESEIEALDTKRKELKNAINQLLQRQQQVGDDLQWYGTIDLQALTEALRKDEDAAEILHSEIQMGAKEILENAARLAEIAPVIATLLNPLNWFSKQQIELRRRRAQLRKFGDQIALQQKSKTQELEGMRMRVGKLTSDLQRYRNFDSTQRQDDLRQIKQSLERNKEELATVEDRIRRDCEMLAQIREVNAQKVEQKKQNVSALQDVIAWITKSKATLQRHASFALHERESDISIINLNIERKKEDLHIVAVRCRRVDELLAPLIQEMQTLDSRKRKAKADLEAAEDLDNQLSSAENSYERAVLHEECEGLFGVGSPRKIIGDRQREVRKLERDYEKAKRRVEDIALKASRRIDTVVIDGNNLCYEGNLFIGLSAIEALLPSLSRVCMVVVVFDAAIRRLLGCDDSAIQKRLGDCAKVHVVASRRMADETVLDLASTSEFTYVLSNDRFGDFNEKSAIKNGQILRHEIVNGSIFIHDLQLRAAYVAEERM